MKLKIQNPKTISRRLAIMFFSIFALLMANSAIAQISLNKTVVQSNVCNQFNVSLQITGVAAPAPVDAILVIDRSGSMAQGSPSSMSYAKTAAINFVRKLFNPTNNPGNINRIGIVSYSSTATLNRQLSYASDSTAIITAINNMVASGSTNIADGFYQAGKEMKNRGRTACNVLRSIVLFTDGVANEGSTYDAGNDRYAGASCTNTPTSPTACTNQAITQGQAAQSFSVGSVTYPTKVFTVGLFGGISGGVQTLAANTLNSAQNGGFFQTESAADLNGIFNQILNQLLWAAKAVPGFPMVSDTITNGFSMVPGTLAVSKGSAVLNGQVIDWTVDFVNTETITLTYTVQGIGPNSCGINQTSSSWMNYENTACVNIKTKFTAPNVCVPCPQASGIVISQSGCSGTIQFTANLTSAETTCNIGTQFYSWEFFLGSQSVGTATGLSGTFTIPSQYATPTCNGTLKGVLSYNSGSGCTLYMGENSLTSTFIIDNTGPVIITAPNFLNSTLQCSDASGISNALTLVPAATDLCTAIPIIHLVSDNTVTNPNCPNAYIRTRIWNFTDGCGNVSLNYTQVITVIDNTVPILTGILPVGQTNMNLCYANIPAGPTANDIKALYTDNCGGNVIVTKSGSPTGNDCNWSVTYTFEVKDACNNIVTPSPTVTYTGKDQTAPSLTGTAFSNATLFNACYANALTAVPAWTQTNAILGYTDNCGGSVTATLTNTAKTGTDCNWTVTYTYTVFDACNNALTNQTYSYSGKDQTAPGLTGTAFSDPTVYNGCYANAMTSVPAWTQANAIVGYTDNCGGAVTATLTNTTKSIIECNWKVTYTYTVIDACNNVLPNQSYSYSGKDQTAPSLTGTTFSDPIIYNGCFANAQTVVPAWSQTNAILGYSDDCGGSVTATLTNTAKTGTDCNWTVIYTYTIKDACNNALTNQSYSHSGKDQTAPALTGIAYTDATFYNACFANALTAVPAWTEANAITGYTDNCLGTVTATLTNTAKTGTDCNWIVTYTYSIKDACQNTLTNQTYSYSGKDQTAPSLTGVAYSDATLYNACYANALTAIPAWTEANAIMGYTDNCGEGVTATLTNTAKTGTDCNWTVTYTYTVKDACLNALTNQTYSYSGKDQTAPSLTGTAYSDITLYNACYANALTAVPAWTQANAIVGYTDNCLGSVTATLTNTAKTGTDCNWTVTYTYTVKDACLNALTNQSYSYSGKDQTAPALTESPYSNSTLYNACYANALTAVPAWTEANAIMGYTDNCGGSVTATLTNTAKTGNDCNWTVTYTYAVKDACLNALTNQTYSYSGKDQTAPSLTGAAYSDATLYNACYANALTAVPAWTQANAIVGYTDNCLGSVTATLTNTAKTGTDCNWTVTYTYEVKDACQNTLSNQTYSYSGKDQTAPSLTGTAYSDATLYNACYANALTAVPAWTEANAILGYTDNCLGSVTATLTNTAKTGTDCNWTVTYTYTVKDACLNALTNQTYSYSGKDQTPPSLTGTAYSDATLYNACFANALTAVPAWTQANAIIGYTDNCLGSVTATLTNTVKTGTDCNWTVTYTYTVKDACNNALPNQTYSYSGKDQTAPSLTGNAFSNNTLYNACFANALTAVPAWTQANAILGYTDNCLGSVTATLTNTAKTGTDCNWTVTYTYAVKDACLNTLSNQTYSYSGKDQTAPSLTGTAYSDATLYNACYVDALTAVPAWTETNAILGYTDNCLGSVTATLTNTAKTGTDCNWTVTYTYAVKDECQNTLTNQTYSYSGKDQTDPIIVCSSVIPSAIWPNFGHQYIHTGTSWDATATDNCSTPTVVFTLSGATTSPNNLSTLNGVTFNYGITIISWTATDACGNTDSCIDTLEVSDNTPPIINCPPTINVTCINLVPQAYTTLIEFINAGGFVDDNTGIDTLSFILLSESSDLQACPETITRIYQIADIIGNTSQCTQLIIVDDTIAPTFTRPLDITIYTTANCTYNVDVTYTGDVTDEADNCSTDIQATFVDASPVAILGCEGGYTIARTWSLVDNCGNEAADQVQTITILDSIAPTFTAPPDITIYTNANCSYDVTVAFTGDVTDEADNCSTGIQATFVDASPVAILGCEGGYTIARTWSLIDNCGNAAADQFQTITIRDNIAPTFTAPPDITIYTDTNCSYDVTVAFTGDVTDEADNCSTGIQATFVDASPVAILGCEGGYTIARTWSLIDSCGNAAADQLQTITIRDNIAPTFTAPSDITIYTDANCSYDVTVAFTGDVTDEADNCSTGIQATFVDASPVAILGCEGGYTIARTWSLIDNCGNSASNQVQIITISDSITPTFTAPPDITIYTDANCSYDVTVAFTGDVTDEADNCSTGIQATFVDALPVAILGCEGGYTIARTWSLIDNCGNSSADQLQIITIRDSIAPTFTAPPDITIYTDANCSYDVTVAFTGDVTDEADNCSTGIQATFVDASPIAILGCEGGYTIARTWSLIDSCGNSAANQVQIITISDSITPTFTAPPDITIYTDANCSYDVTVAFTGDVTDEADNCSTGIQATFVDASPVAILGCEGGYTIARTWSLVDNCGNAAADQVQIITIRDSIAPTFTSPPDITIYTDANCSYDATVAITGDVTNEADNCSVGIEATYTDDTINGSCVGSKIITRTWHLVDNCGNAAADQVQTITVNDNIAPVISCPPAIISCSLQFTLGTATATDNCDPNVIITNNAPAIFPVGITNVTWTATDACGNASTCQQSVTVNNLSATADSTAVTCFNGNDGSIEVIATGGITPLSYSIDGGTPQSSNIFTGLAAGTYTIKVTDATNNCNFSFVVEVLQPQAIIIDNTTIKSNCSGVGDGRIDLKVEGGVGGYEYSWSNGETTEDDYIANINAGTYSVTVTDGNGCVMLKSAIEVVPDPTKNPIVIYNAFSPNGDGINDYWVIQAIDIYPGNEVIVLNRWGNEVFSMKDYKNNWDGSNLAEGTYLYIIKGICDATLNGYITIIR